MHVFKTDFIDTNYTFIEMSSLSKICTSDFLEPLALFFAVIRPTILSRMHFSVVLLINICNITFPKYNLFWKKSLLKLCLIHRFINIITLWTESELLKRGYCAFLYSKHRHEVQMLEVHTKTVQKFTFIHTALQSDLKEARDLQQT